MHRCMYVQCVYTHTHAHTRARIHTDIFKYVFRILNLYDMSLCMEINIENDVQGTKAAFPFNPPSHTPPQTVVFP